MSLSRRYRWVSVALIIGFATVLVISRFPPRSSYAQGQDLTTLNQTALFDIPSDASSLLSEAAAGGGVLWFLMHGAQYDEIVATDTSGVLQKQFSVASSDTTRVDHICASSDGRLSVLHRDGQIELYSKLGELMKTLAAARQWQECTFVGPNMFVVRDDNVAAVEGIKSGLTFATPPQRMLWPLFVVGFGGHSVGVVEIGEAVLNVLDVDVGVWERRQLTAPEIQGVARPPRTLMQVVPAFASVAADPTANYFYALATPVRADSGAVILQFTAQGVLSNRFRCPLPKSIVPPSRTNPAGHFKVSSIITSEPDLFLVSYPQKKVLSFSIK